MKKTLIIAIICIITCILTVRLYPHISADKEKPISYEWPQTNILPDWTYSGEITKVITADSFPDSKGVHENVNALYIYIDNVDPEDQQKYIEDLKNAGFFYKSYNHISKAPFNFDNGVGEYKWEGVNPEANANIVVSCHPYPEQMAIRSIKANFYIALVTPSVVSLEKPITYKWPQTDIIPNWDYPGTVTYTTSYVKLNSDSAAQDDMTVYVIYLDNTKLEDQQKYVDDLKAMGYSYQSSNDYTETQVNFVDNPYDYLWEGISQETNTHIKFYCFPHSEEFIESTSGKYVSCNVTIYITPSPITSSEKIS